MLFFPISPFPRPEKSRSLAPRPFGEWMTRTLALAEMPEINHRISQAIHGSDMEVVVRLKSRLALHCSHE